MQTLGHNAPSDCHFKNQTNFFLLPVDGKGGDEAANMLKKAETNNEESPFGELTQRLVAGLMEENAINPADVEESTKKGEILKTTYYYFNQKSVCLFFDDSIHSLSLCEG